MRRYVSLGAAALTCPCHLPLVAVLLAGTAAGGFITRNLTPLFVLFGVLFALSLWLFLRSTSGKESEMPVATERGDGHHVPTEDVVRVKILKTPGCASCNGVERGWQLLRPQYEGRVHLEVVDLLDYPEAAKRYGVLRTPAVIVNERLRTQGSLSDERLRLLLDEALRTSTAVASAEEGIRA